MGGMLLRRLVFGGHGFWPLKTMPPHGVAQVTAWRRGVAFLGGPGLPARDWSLAVESSEISDEAPPNGCEAASPIVW
jgi:hypothetical protein